MAIIKVSDKLSRQDSEYLISSANTVFFRLVELGDEVLFMSATAKEDDGSLQSYPDQESLVRHTANVLEEREFEVTRTEDRQGRPYAVASVYRDQKTIDHLAALILDRLGIDTDISVLAVREMRSIYDNLSVEDGEDAYLSDGMWITPDGRLVDRG